MASAAGSRHATFSAVAAIFASFQSQACSKVRPWQRRRWGVNSPICVTLRSSRMAAEKKAAHLQLEFCNGEKERIRGKQQKENQMPPETFEFQETVPSTPQHPPSKMEMKLPETRQVVKLTLNQTRKPLGSFPTIDSKNHPTAGRRFFPSPFRWGHQRTSSENTIDYSGRGGKKEDTMINP